MPSVCWSLRRSRRSSEVIHLLMSSSLTYLGGDVTGILKTFQQILPRPLYLHASPNLINVQSLHWHRYLECVEKKKQESGTAPSMVRQHEARLTEYRFKKSPLWKPCILIIFYPYFIGSFWDCSDILNILCQTSVPEISETNAFRLAQTTR